MKPTAWVLVMVFIAVVAAQTAKKEKAFFRADIKARGFKNQEELTESSINFLPDSLLLVTINELWTIPTQRLGNVRVTKVPLNADSPPSTFVLFDLDRQVVSPTSELSVQKLKRT